MKRIIRQSTAEAIAAAYDLLPGRLGERLAHVEFAEVDPMFVGLHHYDGGTWAYNRVAHCCFSHLLEHLPASDRRTTIVLPPEPKHLATPETVVHELGHALHELDDFVWDAPPCTEYAKTNRWEAFAEAFASWVVPGYLCGRTGKPADHVQKPTEALLENWAYA